MPQAAIDEYDFVPNIEGPKLHRFKQGRYRKIEYLELLGHSDKNDALLLGDHSYVFSVLIDSEPFALKVVSFRFLIKARADIKRSSNSSIRYTYAFNSDIAKIAD